MPKADKLIQKRSRRYISRERPLRHLLTRRQLLKRLDIAGFRFSPKHVDVQRLVAKIESRVKDGVTTQCISQYTTQAAFEYAVIHPAYSSLARNVEIADMHKTIQPSFSVAMKTFGDGTGKGPLSNDFLSFVEKYHEILDTAVVHLRDYDHTLQVYLVTIQDIQKRFLARKDGQLTERIQHMYMRIAVSVHLDDIGNALHTYDLLSSRQIALDAFMTIYAGTKERAMSSSYSIALSQSNVHELYDGITRAAFTARKGGTVAVSAQGLPCNGRNNRCDHNDSNVGLWTLMRFIDGALGITREHEDHRTDLMNVAVEVWHIDVAPLMEFNNMHQHDLADHKSVTTTAVSIQLGNMLTDHYSMQRVDDNSDWSMFCPKNVPKLLSLTGQAFDDAYRRYEESDIQRVTMKAKDMWETILQSMILTGGPSIIFKDNLNGKSNVPETSPSCQSDMRNGMVDSLGDEDELYPRNHTSIALPLFISRNRDFDFEKLHQVVKEVVYLLNRNLDASTDQLSALADRNKKYRSIAIGMHGLADVFTAMRMPFESLEAAELNIHIAETMYHGALEASWELALNHGAHQHFNQTPMANGIMQFDFWEVTPTNRYDWHKLSERICANGTRNATLIAIGPQTAAHWPSGFTDSTEPVSSNLLDGNIASNWLVEDLIKLGLWNDNIRQDITNSKGSIQHIPTIPADIKAIYRTAWEIDPTAILQLALGRAPFVCHSQSVSMHIESPTIEQMSDLMMRAWTSGLKSGLHRLYSRYPEQTTGDSSDADCSEGGMSFADIILTEAS
ncbi:ribonucleotide reductase [Mycena metata]|uniref:Ribonucleotide reductase n=1 Tax=Mycena metata TaxID=1033252 RepID=A0AAD7IBQ5_9AGAR|nr:ribonucleotide reductase [Mycena metata]